MRRGFQIAGILLLAAAGAIAQKAVNPPGNPRKVPPPPGAKGLPKGLAKGLPKGAGPRLNPANQFERLIAMPPEKREQVIERLPPPQQERLRARLDQFDKLPPQQKALRMELANRYFALPQERQAAYAEQIQSFNKLQGRRKIAVAQELRTLWQLSDADRKTRLGSEDYKTRFSPDELHILTEISAADILRQ